MKNLIFASLLFCVTFLNACAQGSPTAGQVVEVNESQFYQKVFSELQGDEWDFVGENDAVLYFTATWCGPCQVFAPTYVELAAKYKNVDFYKIDIDKCPNVSRAFGIQSIPAFVLIPLEDDMTIYDGGRDLESFSAAIEREF